MNVVKFAEEVLALDAENAFLRKRVRELEKYEQMYHELLNSSIQHHEQLFGRVLTALIDKPELAKKMTAIEEQRL